GMFSDAAQVLESEAVRADHADLFEVHGRPLKALGRLDAAHDESAPRASQPQRGLDGLGAADGVVDDARAVLQPLLAAPGLKGPLAGQLAHLVNELVGT